MGPLIRYTSILFISFFFLACRQSKQEAKVLFDVLDHTQTGLDFANKLTPAPDFNMFRYMYFYNGGGVGAGDFNNDGLIDLFFSANQTDNKLYLNTGNLRFKDVTVQARVPQDRGWSTGVSVVDINNDGMLDIYVCKVGKYEKLSSRNQLLVCTGIGKDGTPQYKDMAAQYGLDFSGFSTQAAFLDYDTDGDLDMYLMNHSLRFNGTFSARTSYAGTYDLLAGDRVFRNEGNLFIDVTRAVGINSSVIGYGLGICVSDIDLDGYPDLYIGNDFHENDYLYINQRNGTFKEVLTERTTHISQFSMGVDVADANNDAQPEIISMDMLPYDPYILRRSLGEDAYDVFNYKVKYGYHPQYARNNLQYNRGNGLFSELGMYAGVHATDWSWAPLWMDFDNDGQKDLFITNGIPKRLNDIDYVNYVSNDQIQEKIRANRIEDKDMALIEKFPQIKLPNQFFMNRGQLVFEELGQGVADNPNTYSNGAVYADFDNDGDLDIVVNNIDEPALLYRNNTSAPGLKNSIQVKLQGDARNRNAIGTKLLVFHNDEIMSYEKYPVRGFQSSMEVPVHLGLGAAVDSVLVVWPDNTYEHVPKSNGNYTLTLTYKKGLPAFDYSMLRQKPADIIKPVSDITIQSGLLYKHKENPFVEFDREPLIPRMVSTEGPALATGDMNKDGLEDVFIGSSKGEKSAIFLQRPSGKFERSFQPALDADSTYEDVDACWIDVNNDGYMDLVVASGGNEYYGIEPYLTPRVYLNNNANQLMRQPNAFDSLYMTASCVKPCDFDGDGHIDLFIGGRAVPWEYGEKPRSYLLRNVNGTFKDVTAQFASGLGNIGLVKQATWADIDKDGDQDLLLALEWDGLYAFLNDKGRFTQKQLTSKKGWWNFIMPCDVDNDGDLDLVAGNLGLNSRLKASEQEPVRLYHNDFDNNGKREQVLTYYLQGKEIPFATKAELDKQIPLLKKRFLYAEDFAKASLSELFTQEKLDKATKLSADYFANALLINKGNLQYELQALPWEAQLTPYNDAAIVYADNDSLPDILLGGNFYHNNIQMGMYDADYGTLLLNRSNRQSAALRFAALPGLPVKGQVRRIKTVRIGKEQAFVLARNNDSVMVIQFGRAVK
ncbi:MAG TPA: VCBS repeat-containing protein [Chitinophagaceae bacterium]|nr:VCBS repeat-containing protein [Chitinophagaceae bacterium]